MAAAVGAWVKARRAGWEELERLLARLSAGRLTADEVLALDRSYREASADLAHARLAYPSTEVEGHLNQLVARAHGALHVRRPERMRALRRFATEEVPEAFARHPAAFRVAVVLFLLGLISGALAVLWHPETAAALVNPGIRAHVAEGRLWTDGALDAVPPALLSAKVFTNNVAVALTAFAGGLLAGLPTFTTLVFNGLTLGAAFALCSAHGLGFGLLGFVLAHGLVELTCICVAGQAGLVLASALWAPGGLERGEALRERGRDAVRLLLGVVPVLVGIGLVEGFVSPGRFIPLPVRAVLGVGLWLLLLRWLTSRPVRPA